MKNNEFFNAMQKKLDKMTYGEFYEFNQHNSGKTAAFGAWREGNEQNLSFPFLTRSLHENQISDFLGTIEEAGFKKFGFFSRSANDTENIAEFLKSGWKLIGTFEFEAGLHETVMVDGLVFQKKKGGN